MISILEVPLSNLTFIEHNIQKIIENDKNNNEQCDDHAQFVDDLH
jgi:hypothetical protein